jgi:hypothetical protein
MADETIATVTRKACIRRSIRPDAWRTAALPPYR